MSTPVKEKKHKKDKKDKKEKKEKKHKREREDLEIPLENTDHLGRHNSGTYGSTITRPIHL